jgi:hypothetical protein
MSVVTLTTKSHNLSLKVIEYVPCLNDLSFADDSVVTVDRKGLHVFSISFKDKNGKEHEIIIGPEKPEDAVKDRRVSPLPHFGPLRADSSLRSSCTL